MTTEIMATMTKLWTRTRRLCGVDALNLWMWRRHQHGLGEIASLLDVAGMRELARDVRAVTR